MISNVELGKFIMSPKQREMIRESKARYNIFDGAASSGKTLGTFYLLPKRIRQFKDEKGHCILSGKTERTVYRNIILSLQELYGEKYVSNINHRREAYIFGQRFFVVGANDEKSVSKIQGMTVKYAYNDEVALYPQSYFEMLKSRLRTVGALCDSTCNPESPYHWFKRTIIDNDGINKRRINFCLDDGKYFLPSEYIGNIKKEYTGVYYKRYVEGEWAIAEGAIYDMWDDEKNVISELDIEADYYITSIDYATSSVCTFELFAVSGEQVRMVKQYYYDAQKTMRQKTDVEYRDDYAKFVTGYEIEYGYIDPSASSLRLELRNSGFNYFRSAKNDVGDGIKLVQRKIRDLSYKILKDCKEAIREKGSYGWCPKAQSKGLDEPIKKDDHSSDAERYALYTHFRRHGWRQ